MKISKIWSILAVASFLLMPDRTLFAESIAEPSGMKAQAGKRFEYELAWNGIPIGRIVANVGEEAFEYKGNRVYQVTLKTESNEFLSMIYKVDDRYISYVDADAIESRYHEADRKEGTYRKHLVIEYDLVAKKAVYHNLRDGTIKSCSIEKDVQDPLSAMCRFMNMSISPGSTVQMTINLNEKNYKLYGDIGNVEKTNTPWKKKEPSFSVRPYAMLNGERYKRGHGYLFFSAEKCRYPLRGVIFSPFGSVTAVLTKVDGPETGK